MSKQESTLDEIERALEEADIDIDKLVGRVENLPDDMSKRALLSGAAAGAGGASLLSAMTGTASAGTNQVGSIGTDNNRLDAEIEDLDLTDQSSTPTDPGTGQARVYFKNGSPYYKVNGGSETPFGSGSGGGSGPVPTAVRVYKDGSDVVALDRFGTEISRNTDAATVIQAAIDDATTAANEQLKAAFAWVDGGLDTYTITSQLDLKDHVGLMNFDLDANGNTGFNIIDGTPASGNTFARGFALRNIIARNAGDGWGIRFKNTAWCPIAENVMVSSCGAGGIQLEGNIGSFWKWVWSEDNSGPQIDCLDNSTVGFNFCHFYGGGVKSDGPSGGQDGIVLRSPAGNAVRGNTFHSINTGYLDNGFRIAGGEGNIIRNTWGEGSTFNSDQIALDGGFGHVVTESVLNASVQVGTNDCMIANNFGGGPVTVGSGVTGTRFLYNPQITVNDNGTETGRHTVSSPETQQLFTGDSAPASGLGSDGDVYFEY